MTGTLTADISVGVAITMAVIGFTIMVSGPMTFTN